MSPRTRSRPDRSAAVAYGRRQPDPALSPADQAKRSQLVIPLTESRVTTSVEAADDYRAPLPCESRAYELTGLSPTAGSAHFTPDELLEATATAVAIEYEVDPTPGLVQKRLIEHGRAYYRRDDLTGPLPLGALESLALPFESYRLAFTPGLVADVYGTRVTDAMLEQDGRYVHTEGDLSWWIPTGQAFLSPESSDSPSAERAFARRHFFLPHHHRAAGAAST
jgi:hypothetical protein